MMLNSWMTLYKHRVTTVGRCNKYEVCFIPLLIRWCSCTPNTWHSNLKVVKKVLAYEEMYSWFISLCSFNGKIWNLMFFSLCILLKAQSKMIKDFFMSKVRTDISMFMISLKHIESEVWAPSVNWFLNER